MRSTVMEVDLNNFLYNINQIKKYSNNKIIMPVIKANAYGTYINTNIDIVNMFDIVCVAYVREAVSLRNIGYKKEILILNQPSIDEIDDIVKYNLTVGLSSIEFLNEMLNRKDKVKVHLEIETGMNRTGIKLNDLEDFISKISKNIIVEGVYTHLSSADFDKKYTLKQLDLFHEAVSIVKKHFDIKYIHSCASNGLLNYNDSLSNAIRPGIIMYGYDSFSGVKDLIDIKPTCTLKTKISFIKDIDANEAVSYSQKFISKNKMRIATIPIGYADGLRRELSNKGYVIVHNKKAKIIGNICMDSCMIDVTDIKNVNINDEVYIFDNKNQTIDDIANILNTINYEVLCTISERVPRVFKK